MMDVMETIEGKRVLVNPHEIVYAEEIPSGGIRIEVSTGSKYNIKRGFDEFKDYIQRIVR